MPAARPSPWASAPDDSGQIGPIAADDASLYYFLSDMVATNVLTVPLTGGSPTPLTTGQDFVSGIAVDATSIYWTDNAAGRIVRLTPK